MAGKGRAQDTFRAKAPWIMALLMRDFPLGVVDAAAILGNLGHESSGLATLQEISPTVKGSKGGYGWAQWTGPRRRAFAAYCKLNKLDPASDQANCGFLFVELKGSEKAAIAAVKKAKDLVAKVKAFELAFERAGAKHYESRNQWAAIAFDAFHANPRPTLPGWVKPTPSAGSGKPVDARPAPEAPKPAPTPPRAPAPPPAGKEDPSTGSGPAELPKKRKLRWSKRFWTWLTTGLAGGGLPALREAGLLELDWTFWAILAGLVVALALIGILTMPEVRAKISRTIVEG